jgi:hypothetical protein
MNHLVLKRISDSPEPPATYPNATHDNIKHHAKTAKTDQKHQPETETARRTQAENQNLDRKNFFQTHTNPLQPASLLL